MTTQKSFKRLVRTRMEKTGESYTAARAMLLAADEPKDTERPRLATSDEEIRRRTGRGWEEWFNLLDDWGAQDRTHREIARWVAEQQGIEPLAWNAQAIAGTYELARGLRVPGERADGRSRPPRRGRWRCRSSDSTTRSSMVGARALAARRRAPRAHLHQAEVGALRLGRRRYPRQRRLRGVREGKSRLALSTCCCWTPARPSG